MFVIEYPQDMKICEHASSVMVHGSLIGWWWEDSRRFRDTNITFAFQLDITSI